MITNSERIAKIISDYGPKSVLIHTVPGTDFWLVMYKTTQTYPNWRCVICNPEQTTWRLVTENLSDEEHKRVWAALLKIRISSKIKTAVHDLKKEVINFKHNKETI